MNYHSLGSYYQQNSKETVQNINGVPCTTPHSIDKCQAKSEDNMKKTTEFPNYNENIHTHPPSYQNYPTYSPVSNNHNFNNSLVYSPSTIVSNNNSYTSPSYSSSNLNSQYNNQLNSNMQQQSPNTAYYDQNERFRNIQQPIQNFDYYNNVLSSQNPSYSYLKQQQDSNEHSTTFTKPQSQLKNQNHEPYSHRQADSSHKWDTIPLSDNDNFNSKQSFSLVNLLMNENSRIFFGNFLDSSINQNDFISSTFNVVPASETVLKKTGLPYALNVCPFKKSQNIYYSPSNKYVLRCFRCGGYCNPFCSWSSNLSWTCNFCNRTNQATNYDSNQPVSNNDLSNLSNSYIHYSVDYPCPIEYYNNTPPIPYYLFVCDLSLDARSTGYIKYLFDFLQQNIGNLHGGKRCSLSIVGFNQFIHYFYLNKNGKFEEIILNYDETDIIKPKSDGLVINISENNNKLIELFNYLSTENSQNNTLVDPPQKLTIAQCVTSLLPLFTNGGRLILFTSNLINIKHASNIKSKTSPILTVDNEIYKKLGMICDEKNIAVDIFCIPFNIEMDSTIGDISFLPYLTGGIIHHIPQPKINYNNINDENQYKSLINQERNIALCEKLSLVLLDNEIGRAITFKIKSHSNLKLEVYSGNFILCNSNSFKMQIARQDTSFSFLFGFDESFPAGFSGLTYFQISALYYDAKGEYRLRIHTIGLRTSFDSERVLSSANPDVCIDIITRLTTDRMILSENEDIHESIKLCLIDICRSSMKLKNMSLNNGLCFPSNLEYLPRFLFGFLSKFSTKNMNVNNSNIIQLMSIKHSPVIINLLLLYPILIDLTQLDNSLKSLQKMVLKKSLLCDDKFYLFVNSTRIVILIGNKFKFREQFINLFNLDPNKIPYFHVLPNSSNSSFSPLIQQILLPYQQIPCLLFLSANLPNSILNPLIFDELIDDKINNKLSYDEYLHSMMYGIDK